MIFITCIVGIVENGVVYIGGDSAGIDKEHNITIIAQDKVNRRNGLLIGFSGQFRASQIVLYSAEIPNPKNHDLTPEQYMCGLLVPEIQKTLKMNGSIKTKNDQEMMGADFLFGFNGKLFGLQNDFGVIDALDDHLAIGRGSDYAFGALHVLFNEDINPEEKLFKALEASEYYNGGVKKPFIVMDEFGTVWERK